jgi:hypothetical protein
MLIFFFLLLLYVYPVFLSQMARLFCLPQEPFRGGKSAKKRANRHWKRRRKEKSRLRSRPVAVFSRPFWEKARVAQLVEQLAFNQLVLGSSPSLRTCLQDGEAGFSPQSALA